MSPGCLGNPSHLPGFPLDSRLQYSSSPSMIVTCAVLIIFTGIFVCGGGIPWPKREEHRCALGGRIILFGIALLLLLYFRAFYLGTPPVNTGPGG